MDGLSVNEDSHSTRNAIHLMIRKWKSNPKKRKSLFSLFSNALFSQPKKRVQLLFFYADSQPAPLNCHFSLSFSFRLSPTPFLQLPWSFIGNNRWSFTWAVRLRRSCMVFVPFGLKHGCSNVNRDEVAAVLRCARLMRHASRLSAVACGEAGVVQRPNGRAGIAWYACRPRELQELTGGWTAGYFDASYLR